MPGWMHARLLIHSSEVRRAAIVATAVLALAAASAAAYARRQAAPTGVAPRSVARPAPPAPPTPPAAPAPETPFTRLPALLVTSADSKRSAELRLYDAEGRVDEAAARRLDEICADARDRDSVVVAPIDRRTLQLVFRAAYHFDSRRVEVVSGYRKPGRRREGLHAEGRAVDFRLEGVSAAELASYLRKSARVGVGVYTHPRTQYVHVDVRETSYHWIDASPPRKRWREQSLGRIAPAHDAAYRRDDDWPEGLAPSTR